MQAIKLRRINDTVGLARRMEAHGAGETNEVDKQTCRALVVVFVTSRRCNYGGWETAGRAANARVSHSTLADGGNLSHGPKI